MNNDKENINSYALFKLYVTVCVCRVRVRVREYVKQNQRENLLQSAPKVSVHIMYIKTKELSR